MPLYTVSTKNPLPETTREKLAILIMDVHCGITGAPETFVNVTFAHNAVLQPRATVNVLGAVRKGRTPDMNDTLSADMTQRIANLLELTPYEIDLSLHEVPAQWVMEGGEILPEPGEEALCEWLQKEHA
ncbi:4-oxalocrotonate tautomerase [Thalassotalea euphylliae]|uniref:4-oxalocrotonate tautomerase n=1 Tax=Thalassotalea euphylliae TaxID=1655234 RepID=A0A3E0U283_9GAMM|nr:4-oxalocrotonate tautomerase [Thalassotalea euphylliae]REL30820.1 4-oxalocrotonate tautomerase [Thalassotalea euphylliae]